MMQFYSFSKDFSERNSTYFFHSQFNLVKNSCIFLDYPTMRPAYHSMVVVVKKDCDGMRAISLKADMYRESHY